MPDEQLLWIADDAPAGIAVTRVKQVRQCLGRECTVLVFDAHEGLEVDAFAAALGTLCGGGELILLLPQWQGWADVDPARARLAPYPLSPDAVGGRFLNRLRELFEASACVAIESEGEDLHSLSVPELRPPDKVFELTEEQQAAVAAVTRVATGHARRPLVLTADRGRGKSTALGVALAKLLLAREKQVLLLAPGRDAVQAVFDALQRELPQGELHEGCFTWQDGRVQFRLPDEQLHAPQACDLLVVDEAAAIPLPLLEALLAAHNRVVFSSTVHGYEGSGRGFALRFTRVLDRVCPQWKALTLEQPVRWVQGDPLEVLLNDGLLLDAEFEPPAGDAALAYQWLSQDELASDERLLRNLFALLVSAHYQTRPSDLRQLLDAPGLHVCVARHDGVIVAAALLVEEGGLDDELAGAICDGERRPHGHMLVQSLAAHAGLCEAPSLRLLRVMRIAVAEGYRNRGIGSALLQQAREWAQQQAFDLFGTAFGIDAPLLRFWRRSCLRVLRLGQRRDPASGAQSVQMAAGLSGAGKALVGHAARRFQDQFPWRLAHSFCQLPPDLAAVLLQGRDCSDLPLSPEDHADIHAFALSRRGLDDAQPVLWRWLCHELAASEHGDGDAEATALLVASVLQNQALGAVQHGRAAGGRAAALKALRSAVKKRLPSG
jgi:tRNA(Met) cytidine acetyltransferase